MQKTRCVLATTNRGKLAEMQMMFSSHDWELVPQSDFNLPEAQETGLTYLENAIIKARHASLLTGLPAIADDSGIEVKALKGAPGIHSARFAGPHASEQARNQKLLDSLTAYPDPEDRVASFQCVIVYLRFAQDPMPIIGLGSLQGIVTREPRGQHGHGYDPILFLPEFGLTVAEISSEQKNQISHRGKAMKMLMEQLFFSS